MNPSSVSPQDTQLGAALEVLSSPVRLAMLRNLRSPKALREIEVRVSPEELPDGHARNLARQTVRDHLERLMAVGAVATRPAERDYGATVEYLLNHQALFAIAEEFRELARLRPTSELDLDTVVRVQPPGFDLQGPCLVLVKGLDEGQTFDLRPPSAGRKSWTVGRRRGLEVSLDFDPFVSTENAVIDWEDGSHFLQDLPESRNGTTLNFKPLPKAMRRALRTGDLIGVGRSILMFRA